MSEPHVVVAQALKRLYPLNPDVVLGREARVIVEALEAEGIALVSASVRKVEAFECDHMRPVVREGCDWYHVRNGRLAGTCTAGVYRVTSTYEGAHSVDRLVAGPADD